MARNSPNLPTVNCVEDILKIPDMSSARELMKRWGVDTKGLHSKDAALVRLIEHWKKHEGNIPGSAEATKPKGLQEAIELDHTCRNKLRDKYDQLNDYLNRLPKQYEEDLNEVFPNLRRNIETRRQDVMSPDCAILVAGERSAGKSSFIDLLLDTDLLPTSQLSCTTTFVELRKSGADGKKSAVVHHKLEEGQKRKKTPILLDLHDSENINTLSAMMKYTEDGESPYEKIEIWWPFQGLAEGVVIVDTPGISDARQMSKLIERYLTKSFGFIYVLNTANAGGVQKGRLRDLLRMVVNAAEDDFDPAATMFIGNKWDQVPASDKQDVVETTFTRLQMCYPGVRRDQLFYMSVTEAQKNAMYGGMSQDHKQMLEGLQRFLPASLRNKLNTHYRYMSQVLKRSFLSVKVAKTMVARGIEEKEEQMENLKRNMEMLDRNARYSVDDLRKGIKFEVDNLYALTADFLRSKQFAARVYQWSERDCAKPDRDWSKVGREANERIASRIASEINVWERQNNVISTIKEKIVKKFKRDFELMEDQIKQIEGVLLEGDTRAITDLHKSMRRQAPVRQLWRRANVGQDGDEESVKGLGGAVSNAGAIGNDKVLKSIFKTYKRENCADKMTESTSRFIENIFAGDDLKYKLEKYLNRFLKGIDTIARMIPDFIKADKKLIEAIKSQMINDKDNLKDVFPTLIRNCSLLQGQLDLFFVFNIMERDYRLRDLEWSKNDLLGSGSFADVFKAKLKVSKQPITVALKISKEPIKENNITDTLLEDRTLRELKHKHVVKYYGATLKEDGGKGKHSKVLWIMIMEYCTDTLKSVVLDQEFDNPGKLVVQTAQLEAMKKMADYAVQICEGLAYLHSIDLVHRDMKLENILVNSDGTIKLTDVGLTRRQVEISGSVVGSPVYMAPEVLLSEGIYNRKADIYSLAVILWEMWYGIDAAEHIQQQLFGTLEKAVKQGLRPSMSLKQKPPREWERIIVTSWEYDPTKRPEAKQVQDFFYDFLHRPSRNLHNAQELYEQ